MIYVSVREWAAIYLKSQNIISKQMNFDLSPAGLVSGS